jgi:hypothetical protein
MPKSRLYPNARASKGLPAPRVEFEKVPGKDGWKEYIVFYWLVIPLSDLDIRREDEEGKQVYDEYFIPVGYTTIQGGGQLPVREDGAIDPPFRDGAHAQWDMKALGLDIPTYVTCVDNGMTYSHLREKS